VTDRPESSHADEGGFPHPMSALRRTLGGGGTIVGTMVFEFVTPGLPALVKRSGADFVLYDMEHSGLSLDWLRAQLTLCRALGLPAVVRPPASLPHLFSPLLDSGACGLKFPNVETAEEAVRLVAGTRYPPEGVRGAAFNLPHDGYGAIPPREAMRSQNAGTLILAQIESERGLANVDEIIGVAGVDIAWLGHFDLSNAMGIPGEFSHPRFLAALDRIVAAADRHGKAAGFFAADPTAAHVWMRRGFRAVLYGRDTSLYATALRDGIAAARRHASAGRRQSTT
jgi:2-keto-3-deoxy-L-rhamnonate aldolase RhmA